MSLAVECPACIFGDHDHHNEGWGLHRGLMGGAYCPCKGECRQKKDIARKKLTREEKS